MPNPAFGFDPWDKREVVFPAGLLAVLLVATEKADEAGILQKCPENPCPYCTAMQDADEQLRGLDIQAVGYDVT